MKSGSKKSLVSNPYSTGVEMFSSTKWYNIEGSNYAILGSLASVLPYGTSQKPAVCDLLLAYTLERETIGGKEVPPLMTLTKFCAWIDSVCDPQMYNWHTIQVVWDRWMLDNPQAYHSLVDARSKAF